MQTKLPKLLIQIDDFSKINEVKKPKHTKVKVAVYCNTCKRKHHLHFGEFKNGSVNARNLQDIIDNYRWKYCNRDTHRTGLQFILITNLDELKNQKNIKEFTEILKNINGFKIVTITTAEETRIFDINENFNFLDKVSEFLFYKMLKNGFQKNAGIIVRQFLDIKLKRVINGKEIWIPNKKLYGFLLRANNIFIIPKDELEVACNTDKNTGLPLEPEEDVTYSRI